ncbi:MAG: GNAT family protein [Pseudomonadota bacterium]
MADDVDADRLGRRVPDFVPPPHPDGAPLIGRYVALSRLSAHDHAAELYDAFSESDAIWTYMPVGPFAGFGAFSDWIASAAETRDPFFYTIIERATGRPSGVASFLRIAPAAGSIEVGHIVFAPSLQRTRAATEAMALMMAWAFDAGYRRYEWKCNALNIASRRAAMRLGLSYEGIFRQAAVIKGRNRDTAWFAAIDAEWPALRGAFDRWFAPENFDASGRQRVALSDLTAPILVARDPEC